VNRKAKCWLRIENSREIIIIRKKERSGISFELGDNLNIQKPIADKLNLFGKLNFPLINTDRNKIVIPPSINKATAKIHLLLSKIELSIKSQRPKKTSFQL
jgi:hypothetical protein